MYECVTREMKDLATRVSRLFPESEGGLLGVVVNASGVFACGVDWQYRFIEADGSRVLSEAEKLNRGIREVRCLVDDECDGESVYAVGNILYFYGLKM